MSKAFKIPIVAPWCNINKRQPKNNERVLIYSQELADLYKNPLLGFQLAFYNKQENKFEVERFNSDKLLYSASYWAGLTLNMTTVETETKPVQQLFALLGVKGIKVKE